MSLIGCIQRRSLVSCGTKGISNITIGVARIVVLVSIEILKIVVLFNEGDKKEKPKKENRECSAK